MKEFVKGLVSVVIPVYNRPVMVYEAIQSVIEQSYSNLEIIVVNDGSTDGDTKDALVKLRRQLGELIKVVHQENGGPGVAREHGRRLARGEFIQYLDSDDLLLKDKLKNQIDLLEQYPECGMALGMSRVRSADGVLHEDGRIDSPAKTTLFPTLLNSRWWGTSAILYRREVSDRAGAWPSARNYEDWQYEAKIGALGIPYCFLPEYVIEIRDHDESRLRNEERTNYCGWIESFGLAHLKVYELAKQSGVIGIDPEMERFVHHVLALAKRCAEAGLISLSWRLLRIATIESLQIHHRGILIQIVASTLVISKNAITARHS